MNQAADQLQKGEVSKALANSTKAQKDLQKMRDEFRKKTSNQFSEQMKQMRKDARELVEGRLAFAVKDGRLLMTHVDELHAGMVEAQAAE